jgi:hypothetical protein
LLAAAILISLMATAVSISSLRGIAATANAKYLFVHRPCDQELAKYKD